MSSADFSGGADSASIIELVGSRLSTATVLFHTAVADRLGVGATDMKCYTILRESGPITAGELARRASLTTGAITGVVDRLEQAGLVRRVADPRDRRRVVLELQPDPEREREVNQLYAPMGHAIVTLLHSYSAADQAMIGDFLSNVTAILERETQALHRAAPPPDDVNP